MTALSPDITSKIINLCREYPRILDVGCGRGDTLERIRAEYPGALLSAIEPDPAYAEKARRICDVTCSDIDGASLPVSGYDLIICQCVYSLFPAPSDALKKLYNALRPGGRLILSDMFTPLEEVFRCGDGLCGRIAPKRTIEREVTGAGFLTDFFSDETSSLLGMAAQLMMDGGGSCTDLSVLRKAKARYGLWVFRRSGLYGIVTAAGLSSRMGDFKPLMKLGGKTMISRCVDSAMSAGAEKVVVVLGHRGDEIRGELAGRSGVIFAENTDYRINQMFDSVRIGLRSAENAQRIMLCPVDVPLVKRSTVSALLMENSDIVRPVCGGKTGHPVIIGRNAVGRILSYEGGGGLKGAITALGLGVTDVYVSDEAMTVDADTMADFERLCRFEDMT